MYKTIQVIVFCLIASSSFAQQWTISGGLIGGKVLKHKKEIAFETPSFSSGIIMSSINQTDGTKPWQNYWGKPHIEINTVFLNFGNPAILGRAIGIIPGYAFYIKKTSRLDFLFHIGMGLGYLTKKNDILNNPENNAIGSHLNNATRFRLSGVYKMKPLLHLEAGVNFFHFSNALSVSPNTGINVYGPDMTIRYIFNANKITSQQDEPPESYVKWKWNLQLGWAQKEIFIPGGPKFPVYIISNAVGYHLSPYLRLFMGYEYEFNNARYFSEFLIFEDENKASRAANRHIIFTAIEGLLGRTGLRFQIGHYPGLNPLINSEAIYFKLNLNVYGDTIWKERLKPYIGILLKSHYSVAEYFAIVGGVEF